MNADNWGDTQLDRESPPDGGANSIMGNARIAIGGGGKRKLSFPDKRVDSSSSPSTSSGNSKKQKKRGARYKDVKDGDQKVKAKKIKKPAKAPEEKEEDEDSSNSSVQDNEQVEQAREPTPMAASMPAIPPPPRAAAIAASLSLGSARGNPASAASMNRYMNAGFAARQQPQLRSMAPADEEYAWLQSLLQQRRHRQEQQELQQQQMQEQQWLQQQYQQQQLQEQQQQLQRTLQLQRERMNVLTSGGISSPRLRSFLNNGFPLAGNPNMMEGQQQHSAPEQPAMFSHLLSPSNAAANSGNAANAMALHRRLLAFQQSQANPLQRSAQAAGTAGSVSDQAMARLHLLSRTVSGTVNVPPQEPAAAAASANVNQQLPPLDGPSARPSASLAGQLVLGMSQRPSPSTTPPKTPTSRSPKPGSRSPRTGRSSSASSFRSSPPDPGMIAPPLCQPVTLKLEPLQLPPLQEVGGTLPHDQRPFIFPLGRDEDVNWLSEFQCFVRSELLEVVRASQTDVQQRVASKKVHYLQAGIRCRYCAHVVPNQRAIRSSAFPSSLRQLYQSVTMMVRDHFGNCASIPAPIQERFQSLKQRNTQGASDSLRYWIYAAQRLGLVDCPSHKGIVVTEQSQADAASQGNPPFGTFPTNMALDAESLKQGPPPPPPVPPAQARLVITPQDQATLPPFVYELLHHVQVVPMLASERLGNRKNLEPGFPGLCCRYCCQVGRLGLSRVFPGKRKHLPPQLPQGIYDHLRRCTLMPADTQARLQELHAEYVTRLNSLDDDDQPQESTDVPVKVSDTFLDKVWARLGHEGRPVR